MFPCDSRDHGRTLVFGTEADYPPYSFLDENGEAAGYNADLTRAIGVVLGLDIELRIGPWAEIRSALENHEIDGISGMYFSVGREDLVDFSPPHTVVQHAIFVRRGEPAITTEEDLRGKQIIVMRGDIMHDFLLEAEMGSHLTMVATQADALRLLASGEHHCALVAHLPGLYWIRELGLTNIDTVGKPLAPQDYCFAVREGDSALNAQLAEGLAILKNTGKLDLIYDQWFGVLDPPGLSTTRVIKYSAVVTASLLVLLALSLIWSRMLKNKVESRTRELLESQERYRTVAEDSPALLCSFLPDGRITYVNDAFCRTFGMSSEELIGQTFWSFIHHEDRKTVAAKIELLTAGHPTESHVQRVISPTGETQWHRWTNRASFDTAGAVTEIQSFGEDITDRRVAEESLKRSQYYLEKAQEIGHIGTWELDLVANKLTWTDENYRVFGVPIGAPLTYETFLGCVHPDDRDFVHDAWMAALDRQPYDIDHRVVIDGEVRWVREKAHVQFDDQGNAVKAIGFTQDITSRKQTQEVIASSLREKETLLREIHHRVKNNMQVVISLLRLQAKKIREPEALAAFSESEDRINAMALVHETLHSSEQLSWISCREYVEKLLGGLADSHHGSSIELSCDICHGAIHIDQAVPLGLIVNELVSNAMRHAFEPGEPGRIRVTMREIGDNAFALEVSDNGIGLPSDFDLETAGSLGLRLVKGLARTQLGGTLEFASDHGARFTTTFDRKLTEEIV